MNTIIYYICVPLGYLMKWCYWLVKNYGVAIILFTLLTKIVLMPISVWIQKNSIRMVKLQPEINFIKANLNGNIDAITEEESKLYKREKYHPMLSIIPLILQIILLLAVIYIINHPLNYLFGVEKGVVESICSYANIADDSGAQLEIIKLIKNGTITASTAIEGVDPGVLSSLVNKVVGFKMNFLGCNLSIVTTNVWGWYILVPIMAGLSSFVMCWTQNLSNVLQREQSNWNKYGIMILSIGLSLYLGLFVPAGTALYWIASNLMSVAVMYLLNWIINPKKFVDYERLEASRKALSEAKAFGALDKHNPLYKQMKLKEKQDYKKFKHIANKHIVIYSEKSGFYKYYKDLINELLKRSNVTIHYVTNDYNDAIFKLAESEPRIKPYYISLKKTAILMMLVETDIFIMTTPDLNKYYLKRSFIKKDIEYIYVPHDTMSSHFGFNEGAFDAFDTVFCAGPHIKSELQKAEEVYGTKKKTLVEFGFPLLDNLINNIREDKTLNEKRDYKQILIAPSWQEDNLLDSCVDDIIASLYGENVKLIVRPHPEYIKRYNFKISELVEKYKDYDKNKLEFELDFSSNKSVYSSDLLITDWSGISAEFAFATNHPCIFINTKVKQNNPNWQKIGIEPIEMQLRTIIGKAIDKEEIKNLKDVVRDLDNNKEKYKTQISEFYNKFTYNHNTAAEVGAKYLLNSLVEKKKNKKD